MQREAFGKLLIILRKKNGLSQKELAERLSVSTSAVSKWENGKNLPDMMMLSRIADILQVSCDELHNPEKTLEKLDNPEFQKRNVEEGDKENTDNTGENKESEPEPQKKLWTNCKNVLFDWNIGDSYRNVSDIYGRT